ncbi:MAG: F0F1 ATP synthase subunit gamma [Thiotrichales bacterium]|nr:F0F1 ATP synthase subunit gamma [Thiotrichales bacterium]
MAFRHDLEAHRGKLQDIRSIMHSMKTLANMETHKLEKRIQAQQAIANHITTMATDFLIAYPQARPTVLNEPAKQIVLLIGSERGFCGDFNGQIWQTLQTEFAQKSDPESEQTHQTQVIALGSKLQTLLSSVVHSASDESQPAIHYLQGADVTEEISHVVELIALTLDTLQPKNDSTQPISLFAIYHDQAKQKVLTQQLLPPFSELVESSNEQDLNDSTSTVHAEPILNLNPIDFYLELTEQFIGHNLQHILTSSLMAENQSRIQHLENATRYLDKKTAELLIKSNALRQEEIIEEIEIILLNQSNV